MTKVAIPKGYDMEGWLIEPQHCRREPSSLLRATGFKGRVMLRLLHRPRRPVLLMDGPGRGTTVFFNRVT